MMKSKRDSSIYYELYEKSPLSYQSLDGEGCFIDVNPAWCKTFGYSREEVLGKKFSDFMTDDSALMVPQRFPVLKELGKVHDADFELIHKDGHVVMVLLHGSSSYDNEGNFQHTHCFLVDVTEKRLSEKLLQKREEENYLLTLQLQALLNSIEDRIVLIDPDFQVVWTNQKTGFNNVGIKEATRAPHCYAVLKHKDSPCADCLVEKVFNEGRAVQQENDSPDGKVMLLRAFPVLNNHGDVLYVVETAQDVTEKATVQKELVRTGQLAAIGELAAGVAHEINNPISGVINYAQLIKNKTSNQADEVKFSEAIIKEGERVAKIVKQLLFLAKDDKNEFRLIDVSEPLSESLALVGTQFHKLGIEIQITLEENLPPIKGHSQHLQQLFMNILSNSRHALSEKYPNADCNKRIAVSLEKDAAETGSQLVVKFHDYGVGIPVELKDKVLQPFVTSKSSAEGTGLGLSISNDIVKAHDGTLSIDSEEGVFTEVKICLPAATVN